jgi:hypothetical protein
MESNLSIDFHARSTSALRMPAIGVEIMTRVTSLFLLVMVCFVSPLRAQEKLETDSAALKANAKTVVEMLVAEDFTGLRQQFSEKLKLELSLEKLRGGWTNFTTQVGSFKRQIDSQAGRRNGLPEVIVKCEFSKAQGYVQIVYDAENKITGLWIALLPQAGISSDARAAAPNVHDDLATRFKTLATAVVKMVADENFSPVREKFNTGLRNRLSEEQMRGAWLSLKQNVGAFKSQLDSSYTRDGGFDVVFVRCQFERAVVQINVAFDAEAKIGGLWFFPAG